MYWSMINFQFNFIYFDCIMHSILPLSFIWTKAIASQLHFKLGSIQLFSIPH
jgi:hypothetical protein